jgi:hypothetical protein
MGFLDKAKAAAEQATAKAKEGVDEVQAKRGLSHAYEDLGKVVFELIESGDLANERLNEPAQAIRDLQARVEPDEPARAGVGANGADAPPPAMPS